MNTYKLDNRLINCLNTYSDTKTDMGTSLKQAFENAAASEKIVPVLGMQGMGKSTLINGLLRENILPNDVDETTCVPVEVKYGESESATVHFFNSNQTVEVNTCEELGEYVDNNHNPGNAKKVERIELFRKNPLLSDGLVIVDLPGVGSMTKVNENTTKHYVENLCSAIFVIPTVPTIRGKEAMFIKGLWSQFSTALFVQNDWGETKEEINESMDFNSTVLKGIAKDLHNPYDGKIILINAYNAIAGALKGDNGMVESSNIKTLYNRIVDLSAHWKTAMDDTLMARLLYSVSAAITVVNKRIANIDKSNEEREKGNAQKLKNFDDTTSEIKTKCEELLTQLGTQCEEIKTTAKGKAAETCKSMRAEMHRVIEGGVYDGDHLTKAFDDYTQMTSKKYFDSVADNLYKLKTFLNEGLEEIAEKEYDEEIGKGSRIKGAHFVSESKFKFEKGVKAGLNIGGAVGGALLAAPVAGFLVSNPAGWAIALVGLAIYGIFSAGGYAVAKGVGASRAREAKRIVDPKIKEIEKQLVEKTTSALEQVKEKVKEMLDNVIEDRNKQRQNLIKSFNIVEGSDDKPRLEADLQYLTTEKKKIENVGK